MAMDFPSSPSEGQIFAPSGGPAYQYSNGAWRAYATAVSQTARTKNYIVNPSMQISQQNGNTGGTTDQYYGADQWYMNVAGLGQTGIGRSAASTVPGGFVIQLASQSTNASLGASAFLQMVQVIEGYRVSDLMWGTSSAKPVVVRFMLNAAVTGTYALALRSVSGGMSYVTPVVVATANTWAEYVIAVPGPTSGTWNKDNTVGLIFSLTLAAGSTFCTTANAWTSGNFVGVTGMTNGAANSTYALNVYDVGLYMDPNSTGRAPPFEMPNYADELMVCQRYWQIMTLGFSGNVTSGQNYYANGYFATPPRTLVSTISGVANGGVASFPNTSGAFAGMAGGGVQEVRTANASGTGLYYSIVTLNARM